MNSITVNIFRFGVALTLSAILAGCNGVSEEEFCENDAQVCWNTDEAPYLKVNQDRTPIQMFPNSVDGYRIPTRVGATYTIVVGRISGSLRFHVAPGRRVDPGANTITSYHRPGVFKFIAEEPVYSVVIEELGRPDGSVYYIQAISIDEDSMPLRDSHHLDIDAAPIQVSLVENELVRFDFDVVRGYDYEVRVNISNGAVNTFLSSLVSNGEYVYDQVNWYSNGSIRFRANIDGRMYIAINDKSQPVGSDFDVQVVQLW